MNESGNSDRIDLIRCSLNGQPVEIDDRSLLRLLIAQGIDPEKPGIAVALNDAVVRRGEWERTELEEGDRVEVITAMQGG